MGPQQQQFVFFYAMFRVPGNACVVGTWHNMAQRPPLAAYTSRYQHLLHGAKPQTEYTPLSVAVWEGGGLFASLTAMHLTSPHHHAHLPWVAFLSSQMASICFIAVTSICFINYWGGWVRHCVGYKPGCNLSVINFSVFFIEFGQSVFLAL